MKQENKILSDKKKIEDIKIASNIALMVRKLDVDEDQPKRVD
jgi:hypothetical protein